MPRSRSDHVHATGRQRRTKQQPEDAVNASPFDKVLTLRDVEESFHKRLTNNQASQRRRRKKPKHVTSKEKKAAAAVIGIVLSLFAFAIVIVTHYHGDFHTGNESSAGARPLPSFPHSQSTNTSVNTDPDSSSRALEETSKRKRTDSEASGLKIVWLMSFPNSGTSYTSQLIRDTSMTYSASNYADETPSGQKGIQWPVFADQPMGPFWTKPEASPEFTEPTDYVLTKTHCGIRCTLCPPEEYAESTYRFRRRCLVTKWVALDPATGTASHQYSTYPNDRVTKAVHIFRNPFDNVVSRFHLERQRPDRTAKDFPATRHGFLKYCLSIDYLYTENEIKYSHFQKNKLLSDLWMVPCHADFMRYIEWHNLAFFTASDLDLETYILHYDWYSDSARFNQTVTELLAFLKLERKAAPTPFLPGKVYDYYTVKEKLIVKRAFEFMASRKSWKHVKEYFPPG